MKTNNSIFIERNGKKYELLVGRDCVNRCSFAKADGPYQCERQCYLSKWFTNLKIEHGFLKEV